MDNLPSKKIWCHAKQYRKTSLESERFKEWFDIGRIRILSGEIRRQEKYQEKIYRRKKPPEV